MKQNSKMFLVFGILAVSFSISGIKSAQATDEMIMGQTNDATGMTATELHSDNSTNTLKVMQDSGNGSAIHAVSNGLGNGSNAIHAWTGINAGSAVYGESSAYNVAGILGVGNKGPGGEFRISDSGAYYQHRGAIQISPQNYLTSDCMGGDLAVYRGDLYFCRFVSGTGTSPLWKKVVLQ